MKNITQLLFLFVLLTYSKIPGQIASWDFTGQNNVTSAAATTFDPNLNSSNLITRGTDAASSTGTNSFRTKGFKNDGISISNNDYFQITLSASTGYKLSLSSIDASFNGTATFYAVPGVTSQFAYSLDGSNFVLIGSPVTSASLVMDRTNLSSISDLQNVPSGKIVTIRYYASGQTATGGWGFYSSSAGSSGLSIWGIVTAISVTKSPTGELPKEFKLNQNYPNPFNPTTVISYQLTMLSHVRLIVYDLLGREEATLVDEEKIPGYYTVLFNGQNCASGNYFYKITAGNIELVKKMTLLK